jgi:protein SCO1/2
MRLRLTLNVMRRTTLKLVLLSAIAAVLACSSASDSGSEATFGSSDDEDGYHGLLLEPLEATPELRARDQDGNRFDRDGNALLLFFGYTNCPDVCPITLADYVRVKDLLGERADQVRFAMIAVDPDRDTPEVLRDYLGRFDPSFKGLRIDSEEDLEATKAAYGVFASALTETGDIGHSEGYLVSHTDYSFLIDPQGRLAVLFRYGTPPADIAEDIEKLFN